MRVDEAETQRAAIAAALAAGQTGAQVARTVGCEAKTVYRFLERAAEGLAADGRRANGGRPPVYTDLARAAVRKARVSEPANGPVMLHHVLLRDPARFGLTAAEVPSARRIGELIHEWGLAVKPVGPRDRRRYPGHAATAPGVLTIDTWGPWPVRANKVYLATIQDRCTRLVAAVPAGAVRYAEGSDEAKPGVTGSTWARAIAVAQRFLVEGRLHALYTDNGVGMVPSFGALHGRLRASARRATPCPWAPVWCTFRLPSLGTAAFGVGAPKAAVQAGALSRLHGARVLATGAPHDTGGRGGRVAELPQLLQHRTTP
jgi:transposase-like protein